MTGKSVFIVLFLSLCCVLGASTIDCQPNFEKSTANLIYEAPSPVVVYLFRVEAITGCPLTNVSVTDRSCTSPPVPMAGSGVGTLNPGVVWYFTCNRTLAWDPLLQPEVNLGSVVASSPTGSVCANSVGMLFPHEVTKYVVTALSNGSYIPYLNSTETFPITVTTSTGVAVATHTLIPGISWQIWLATGTYIFCEVLPLPFGYTPVQRCVTVKASCVGCGDPTIDFYNVISYDLAITKAANDTDVCPLGSIGYTYDVTNAGPASVKPIVADNLCSPVVRVSGDTNGDGLVNPGETWHYACSATAPATTVPLDLINTVTVTAADTYLPGSLLPGDRNVSNNVAQALVHVVPCVVLVPRINIEKSGPNLTVYGQAVVFEYQVTAYNGSFSNVTVNDSHCSPVVYTNMGDTNGNGLLDPNETWHYTCAYLPSFPICPSCCPIINIATVYGINRDVLYTDTDSFTLSPLTVKKHLYLYETEGGDVRIYPDNRTFPVTVEGQPGTFNISVQNPLRFWVGETTVTLCELPLPYGFTTHSGSCVYFIPGCLTSCHLEFINFISYDLAITKTGPIDICVAVEFNYTYTVTNLGPAAVTPVVTDNLCPAVLYRSGDANGDGLIQSTESWTFYCTYTIPLLVPPGTIVMNTARVEMEDNPNSPTIYGGDRNLANNVAVWSVRVVTCPVEVAIQVTKSCPGIVFPNNTITFVFRVTSSGPLTNIIIFDSLCGTPTFIGGDVNQTGVLELGEVWEYRCSYTPTWSCCPQTNLVTVLGTQLVGAVPVIHTSTASCTLFPVELQKLVYFWRTATDFELYPTNDTFIVTLRRSGMSTITDTFAITPSTPRQFWLNQGTFIFNETAWPAGYVPVSPVQVLTLSNTNAGICRVNYVTITDTIYFDLRIVKTSNVNQSCVGERIVYTFTVTNLGPASVVPDVRDPSCVPVYQSGDANANGRIDAGETWKYSCSVYAPSTPALLCNIVTVWPVNWPMTGVTIGRDLNPGDNTASLCIPVVNCAVTINKTCSPVFGVGGVTYNYVVSSTVPLSGVTVVDNRCSPVTRVPPITPVLNPGDIWSYACLYYPSFNAIYPNPLINVATVTGQTPIGTTLTATDDCCLFPVIVQKLVVLFDLPCGPVVYPTTIPFPVVVTLPGRPAFTTTLVPGLNYTWWLPCNSIIEICEFDLPAGYEPLGNPCVTINTATCPGEPIVIINRVRFDLTINKTGPTDVCINEFFNYTYYVTNNGPAAVPAEVVDNTCSPVVYRSGDTNSNGRVDVGEVWEFTCTSVVRPPAGTTVNCTGIPVTNVAIVRVPFSFWPSTIPSGDSNPLNNEATWTLRACSCMMPVVLHSCGSQLWASLCVWPLPFTQQTRIDAVFTLTPFYPSTTLLQALTFGPSVGLDAAVRDLLRQAVTAVLNEAYFGASFAPFPSLNSIITAVNAALVSQDEATILSLASVLLSANTAASCPLRGCIFP